ncbi:GTP-binding protein, partial [Mycolicibacterium sp. CBMA 361]
MADKTNNSTGAAPGADSPAAIRNVVLVGPSGAGKTTLIETLLLHAGVLSRVGSVLDGTTVCDYEPAEVEQQRSVGLALASLPHGPVKINLLDTPGYADFVGELRAGLRAADCALFVMAANELVDAATRALWRECAEVGMPRAVVVTKLDHARATFSGAVDSARESFGDKVIPLYLPNGTELISLLADDAPEDYADDRAALLEGIIEESEDESLMERYL